MADITNLELAKKSSYKGLSGCRSTIRRMGLGDELIKLRAEGHSWREIMEKFDRDHPKANGTKWNEPNLTQYYKQITGRTKEIAGMSKSVAKEASKTVLNTVDGIDKMNRLLNRWIDNMDTKRVITCPACDNEIETFDTDKAVRVCAEIRRVLMTSQNLSKMLPESQQHSDPVTKAVEFTQMLEKMVRDGSIIMVKTNDIGSQVSAALGSKPAEVKKEEPMKLSIDDDNRFDSDDGS